MAHPGTQGLQPPTGGSSLLPVAEAQARVLALGTPVARERVPLADTLGRWTAADVIAARTQPARDLSAMDGYALRFADLPGPFAIIGESAAGCAFPGTLGAGEAVRIFTGAAMPDGADSVLVQEEAAREDNALTLTGEGPTRLGGNVRRRGLDFAQGDVLMAAGERVTPARAAVAATGGTSHVTVARRVRIALAATGDELVEPGTGGDDPEALPESNRLLLRALLAHDPVEIVDLGILPDRLDTLTQAFAAVDADVLVTTGGASVGDHDLVRPALAAAGYTLDFWRIALRPGKPMLAGRRGATAVVGLPGNPVSAFVTALLFVRPLVAYLSGAIDPFPRTASAVLGEPLPANGPRADYLRAARVNGHVHVAAIQDSSMLRTLARADCLVVRAPHAPSAQVGDSVEILDLA